tara:strand:+ start:1976 stop:3073 length:1098 start_codon:yes stop_codon:yes gene_type:complete
MKNYLLLKNLNVCFKNYIFTILTATIFLFIPLSKSVEAENVFTINNIVVEGPVDINFSRDKYINLAFKESFKVLINKILLTRDLKKVSSTKINQIKRLVESFQILEESYKEDIYKAKIRIKYNEKRIKNFLGEKNLSFSQPENISAVFFPVLFVEDELQNFNENFFYKEWNNTEIKNKLINFILPIDDLEDISEIRKMKDEIEKLNIKKLINKYDEKNYVFSLMEYNNNKLNVYLKINFNKNEVSKNIFYEVKNIKSKEESQAILKDLKLKITDLWKEENLINVLMPLSINLKFKHTNIDNLDKLKKTFDKINIIDNYTLEEINIKYSEFKIYYFGNPKKLRTELLQFGYQLKNNQGLWQLYLNE